jgi:hypothetical protein
MDGVLVLSEVHPLRGPDKSLMQARHWFHLIGPEDRTWKESLKQLPAVEGFVETALRLVDRAAARGERLMLRDWTHLDYIGVPFVFRPSYRLTTANVLAQHAEILQVAVVRHPLDQFLSSRVRQGMRPYLRLDSFLQGYRCFAEQAVQIGFQRYEDFARDADKELRALCDRLDVPFDAGYATKWQDYAHVTGDKTGGTSRAYEAGKIVTLPRRICEPELLAACRANRDYQAAIDLLGY